MKEPVSRSQKAEGKRQRDHKTKAEIEFNRSPLSAFRLLLRRVRLWRDEHFAGFHDVNLLVSLPVAIDINLDDDLVALPVPDVTRAESQAVLIAQQGIDRAERVRQLAFKGDRVVGAARVFGKRFQGAVGLQKSHPVDR